MLRLGVYRKSTTDIHNQLVTYFPENIETFNCLLRLYEEPVERKDELLEILKMAKFLTRALKRPPCDLRRSDVTRRPPELKVEVQLKWSCHNIPHRVKCSHDAFVVGSSTCWP